jgi:hypothetical protein
MAAKAGVPQDVINQATGLMEGGIPDVAELKSAVDKLSPEELTSAATKALNMVPADTRAQLGQAIQSYASKSGGSAQVPRALPAVTARTWQPRSPAPSKAGVDSIPWPAFSAVAMAQPEPMAARLTR